MNGLKSLNEIYDNITNMFLRHTSLNSSEINNQLFQSTHKHYKLVKTELAALDIIVTKDIDIKVFKECGSAIDYNSFAKSDDRPLISPIEFNFLKGLNEYEQGSTKET